VVVLCSRDVREGASANINTGLASLLETAGFHFAGKSVILRVG
jgi:hypothetical protein